MNYRLTAGVTLECADGVYVFLKNNGDAAVLDFIGGEIVSKLLSGGSNACLRYILDNYEVDYHEATTDIEEFVCELEERKLVEKVDE